METAPVKVFCPTGEALSFLIFSLACLAQSLELGYLSKKKIPSKKDWASLAKQASSTAPRGAASNSPEFEAAELPRKSAERLLLSVENRLETGRFPHLEFTDARACAVLLQECLKKALSSSSGPEAAPVPKKPRKMPRKARESGI